MESPEEDRGEDKLKEQIHEAIGSSLGKWQLKKCAFIIGIIWMPASFHLLKLVFFKAKTDFWCSPPPGFNEDTYQNLRMQKQLELSSNSTSEQMKCMSLIEEKEHCNNGFTYDRSIWHRTIIQEFDLVCERAALNKISQQVVFFGLLIGVFVSGLISDRFGRVKGMLAMLILCLVSSLVCAFAPNYYVFLIGLWGCGFAAIGFGTVMYCWMMELLSGDLKTIFGCMPHYNYAFWGLIVALVAYFVPDYFYMEILWNISFIGLFSVYWVLPESPRWLLTHGRTEEAEAILRDIAECNGKPLPKEFKLISPNSQKVRRKSSTVSQVANLTGTGILGFLALFRTPNLRKKTLITYYLWFATSTVYYGLTMNSNDFGGASLFTYFTIGKALEFPAVTLVIILLLKAGRRITVMTLYTICGLCLVSTAFIPQGVYPHEWPHILMNVLGRACGTGGLCLCYVYSAEVFPTVIRNVGIGTCSVWARVGPMLAPYIADLRIYNKTLPLVIFGCIALFGAFSVTFMPETAHSKLPDTIEEGEELGKGDTLYSCIFKKRGQKS